MFRKLHLLSLLLFLPGVLFCQAADTLSVRYRAHVVRFNPTPMLIWGNMRNITFNYEYAWKATQSFSVQAGYLELNPVFHDSIVLLSHSHRDTRYGLNLAFDYRFYPLKMNKYAAPRGLYLGPYLSYYGFHVANEVELVNTDPVRSGTFSANFSYLNLGIELGYQFVFWDHFAVDLLLFGPSATATFTGMQVDGMLTDADRNTIAEDLKEKVKEKYPYLAGSLDMDGHSRKFDFKFFFRYAVSLGYKF